MRDLRPRLQPVRDQAAVSMDDDHDSIVDRCSTDVVHAITVRFSCGKQKKNIAMTFPQSVNSGRLNSSWKRLIVRRSYDSSGTEIPEITADQDTVRDCHVGALYTSKQVKNWEECKNFAKTTLKNNFNSEYSKMSCNRVKWLSNSYSRPTLMGQMNPNNNVCYLYATHKMYQTGIYIGDSDAKCQTLISSCL